MNPPENHSSEQSSGTRPQTWRRQGLLGGLAAVAAGLLAARSATPARATDGDMLEIGNTANPFTGPQSSTRRTELNRSNPTDPLDDAVLVTNDRGGGIAAIGTTDGVNGSSTGTNGNGVRGVANVGTSAFGVWGTSTTGLGVVGQGSTGVRGMSPAADGTGVWGSSEGTNGLGVLGEGITGVRGTSRATGGSGVVGQADTGANAYGVWGSSSAGYGVVGFGPTGVRGSSGSTTGTGVLGEGGSLGDGVRGSSAMNGVSGTSTGANGNGVVGDGSTGVRGTSATTNGTGVLGQANSGPLAYGLWGLSSSGYGVVGDGPSGVRGTSGVATGRGVVGEATGSNGTGVVGEATGSGNSWGMWGKGNSASGFGVVGEGRVGVWGNSPDGVAGRFDGQVNIVGTLNKSAGGFKIDHPLDPANAYLVHSFVESPDMLNVYHGTATTDAQGEAVVTLPSYFEVLNRDVRYQLTVLGQFAQAIVASEVQQNRFTIKTDKPNVRVSWQVTGIRKDPYAEQRRLVPEEPKTTEERGKYLHPELYGQPKTAAIGYQPELRPNAGRPVGEPVKQLEPHKAPQPLRQVEPPNTPEPLKVLEPLTPAEPLKLQDRQTRTGERSPAAPRPPAR
jgi:hypothetical protein